MPTTLTNFTIPDTDDFESTNVEGMWTDLINALTVCDTAITQLNSRIAVYSSAGVFKAGYATIELAVAALVGETAQGAGDGDILILKSGEYTLLAPCDITKAGVKIIGEGIVQINGAVGANYCFRTVLGGRTKTSTVSFKNLYISHADDASQIGIEIANASATARINVGMEDVSFGSDGGNSIQVDHTVTTSAIRLYVQGGTIEGPVNFTVKNSDDRMRFNGSTLRGGLVTSADATLCEIFLNSCIVKAAGVTGGATQQLAYASNCVTETDDNPNVYAGFVTGDFAGLHTESLLWPAN
jgi:hypothetical protein